MSGRRRESLVFTVVVSVIAALAAVPMAVFLAVAGEPTSLVLAACFALVPVAPVLACYLWLDRYEPEPRSLLVAALAWGAFVSTLLALLVQAAGSWLAGWSAMTSTVLGAPVSEEATKGLFLLLLFIWKRQELDGVLDGIVYAGFVGVGFAFTENILYLAAAYQGTGAEAPGGLPALGATFVVRCLVSPFAHPLFTAMTGIGLGIAIGSRSTAVRFVAPVLGYLAAVALHAAWNGGAQLADGAGFFGVYVVVMLPLFGLTAAMAIWVRTRERAILGRALQDAAERGLIPPGDIPHVVDLGARRRARRFAREQGGAQGLAAMRTYQQAAIELGYLHHRVMRQTAPPRFADRGQLFVERMHEVRPWIAFPRLVGGQHR